MKQIIFYLIACLTWSCGNIAKHKTTVIDPGEFIPKAISLSEFADDITYIPLSNKSLIQYITSIQIIDDKIFIAVTPQQLSAYNLKGEFLYNIGRKGHGPGEYLGASEFSINPSNEKIYILNRKEILVYDKEGKYESKINIPTSSGSAFMDIEYANDSIYLFESINMGYAKYNWLIVDDQGNEIGSKLNYIPKFKTRTTFLNNVMYKYLDKYFYWNNLNDTIFEVTAGGEKSHFIFAKNQYRLTPENYDDPMIYEKNIFRPQNIIESNNYLFVIYQMKGRNRYAMLDKSEQQVYTMSLKNVDDAHDGFINDLDGGVYVNPLDIIQMDGANYLVSWVNAVTLKEHVKSSEFRKFIPQYYLKKNALKELAKSLNENDNPVLMLVKLKE